MLRQAFIILFITFFLAEIAFIVFKYIHPSFMFHDTSYNRFRGKPHDKYFDFRLNSKGLKDVEFNKNKEAGAYRILGIGDSFAFGVVPYKNNYLTLLEEDLNKNGQKIELINMGIPGIGPKDYYELLMDEGLELKPDMVLVSFFIGNDFLRETEERKLYYTGFRVNSGEYKVMGLAPYGEPKYVSLIKEKLVEVRADGSLRMNHEYFGYAHGLRMTNRAFAKLLGDAPRKPESKLRSCSRVKK